MKFEGLKLQKRGGGGSKGVDKGILTTTSIIIDISRGIAINVVYVCIHGSFLHSNIGADASWFPYEEIASWLVGNT
jgi:hypothetical protein